MRLIDADTAAAFSLFTSVHSFSVGELRRNLCGKETARRQCLSGGCGALQGLQVQYRNKKVLESGQLFCGAEGR